MDRFGHQDILNDIDRNIELGKKLAVIHETLKATLPFVSHIAATLYDSKTDMLKTFVHCGDDKDPLEHYQAKLSGAPSLMEILQKGRPRAVNNIAIFDKEGHAHTKQIKKEGYLSSYTMPMYVRGSLLCETIIITFFHMNCSRRTTLPHMVNGGVAACPACPNGFG